MTGPTAMVIFLSVFLTTSALMGVIYLVMVYLDGRSRGWFNIRTDISGEGFVPSLYRLGIKRGRLARARKNVENRLKGLDF